MHMKLMFKNTNKWMTFVSIPYELIKNKFCTTIITKFWPMKSMIIAPNVNMDVVHACNKIHDGYMVRWNGVLEGWKENGEGSWRGLIGQNQDIHTSSTLELHSLTSYIRRGWTSHTRLSVTIFLILKTMDGLGISNYMWGQVLT